MAGFGKPVPRTSETLSAGLRRDIARYVAEPTSRNFVLRTDLVVHELLTHRLFVYLRRDWKLRAVNAEPFVLGRITYHRAKSQ